MIAPAIRTWSFEMLARKRSAPTAWLLQSSGQERDTNLGGNAGAAHNQHEVSDQTATFTQRPLRGRRFSPAVGEQLELVTCRTIEQAAASRRLGQQNHRERNAVKPTV